MRVTARDNACDRVNVPFCCERSITRLFTAMVSRVASSRAGRMQFIDLGAQRLRIQERLEKRIAKVLGEGRYILGPEVSEFEEQIASYVGVKHVVACANGTDALL